MNLEELKSKLDRELGYSITNSLLTDDQASDAVNSAVSEYSRYRPILNIDSISSTASKASYDISDRRRIIRVKEVYYTTGFSWTFGESFPDPNIQGRLEGINIFNNPSIWTQYMQRLEQYQNIFNGSFQYNKTTKMLRLIPVPTMDGRPVPFLWTQAHTPDTVPEDDIEGMMMWAVAKAKEYMANKSGQLNISQVQGFGQSVTLSTDTMRDDIEDLKKQFRDRFGAKSSLMIG